MNSTFSEQIKAIQIVRSFYASESHASNSDKQDVDSVLNDAASSIAYLNLTKDLPSEGGEKVRMIKQQRERIQQLEIILDRFVDAINAAETFQWRGYYVGNICEISEKAKEILNNK